MGIKLSNEVISQIPILYEELKNKAEVARRLNISVASVNKYLKEKCGSLITSNIQLFYNYGGSFNYSFNYRIFTKSKRCYFC